MHSLEEANERLRSVTRQIQRGEFDYLHEYDHLVVDYLDYASNDVIAEMFATANQSYPLTLRRVLDKIRTRYYLGRNNALGACSRVYKAYSLTERRLTEALEDYYPKRTPHVRCVVRSAKVVVLHLNFNPVFRGFSYYRTLHRRIMDRELGYVDRYVEIDSSALPRTAKDELKLLAKYRYSIFYNGERG